LCSPTRSRTAFGAKLRRTEGRVDDIGEHDGCEDAFVSLITLLPVRPHRLEVDRDPWLVSDHPRIMSWRDLEDIARADLEFRAVRHLGTQATRLRDSQVMVLAGIRARDRFHVH